MDESRPFFLLTTPLVKRGGGNGPIIDMQGGFKFERLTFSSVSCLLSWGTVSIADEARAVL